MTYPARVLSRHLHVLEHQIREYTVLWLRIAYGIIRENLVKARACASSRYRAVFSAPAINGLGIYEARKDWNFFSASRNDGSVVLTGCAALSSMDDAGPGRLSHNARTRDLGEKQPRPN